MSNENTLNDATSRSDCSQQGGTGRNNRPTVTSPLADSDASAGGAVGLFAEPSLDDLVRQSESKRRKRRFKEPVNQDHEARRCWWVNPILGWDSGSLVTYRQRYDLPQCEGAALIHKSGECLCGAMAKADELPEIEFWFPETGRYIRDLEKEAEKAGKPYCRWGWGHDKRVGVPAPGPLCQGCSLLDRMEAAS